jgi:hypothetical protein
MSSANNALAKTQKTSENKTKSKAKIAFEKLLGDLEKRRTEKDNLEKNLRVTQTKVQGELLPLQLKSTVLLRKYLIRLDELAREIGVGKVNKEWFDSYMAESLRELLDDVGFQDEEILSLFTKYSGDTLDDIIEEEGHQEIADAMKDLVGFDIDIKEFLQKGEKQFFEDNKDRIEANLGSKANLGESDDIGSEKKNVDKTDVSLKKDARNVYMQLVKKLHPDLETDETEKIRRTEVVKEVTDAYQKNDFFTLIKLYVEHLGEGETESEKLAEDMLKGYNKLLKTQLAGIKNWIEDIKYFEGDLIEDFLDKNLKFSPQKFSAQKKQIEKEIKFKESDLLASTKRPKTWFKEQMRYIKQSVQEAMMEDMFFNMFGNNNPF